MSEILTRLTEGTGDALIPCFLLMLLLDKDPTDPLPHHLPGGFSTGYPPSPRFCPELSILSNHAQAVTMVGSRGPLIAL